MGNMICPVRVRKLHLIFIIREYCFSEKKKKHFRTEYFCCSYFDCLLKELLKNILIERNHQKYLFYVNIHSLDDVSDSEIIKKMIVFEFFIF